MNTPISYSLDYSQIQEKELTPYVLEVKTVLQQLQKILKTKTYDEDECSIFLPFDESYHKKIHSVVLTKKKYNPQLVVVVGIGGSNLGTLAILEAIKGKLHLQQTNTPKVLFAESTDTRYINNISQLMKHTIAQRKKVLLVVISKSGSTTETIANAQVLYDVLEAEQKDAKDFVVTITDKQSPFDVFSQQKGFTTLYIPKKVGGRFSVFSAVGLFVLDLVGINVKKLLLGAQDMITQCTQKTISKNPALSLAITRYLHTVNGKNIHDLFLFDSSFESIGKWYRQLMAESLGKEHNVKGERVLTGFTPTVSIGSTDLHSVGQLYLGGPKDKFTTFITIDTFTQKQKITKNESFASLIPIIEKKSLDVIMDAIVIGVQKAYQTQHVPYTHIQLPKIDEYAIGQLLQLFMIEVMFVGKLLQVHTFDQPHVELYKIETKKVLEESNK